MPDLGTIATGAGIIIGLVVFGWLLIRWAHKYPLRPRGPGGD